MQVATDQLVGSQKAQGHGHLLETGSTLDITPELQSSWSCRTLASVYVLCPLLEHVPVFRSGAEIRGSNKEIRRELCLS